MCRGFREFCDKRDTALRPLLSPVLFWIGFRMNLSDSAVQPLQMYWYGVRPLSVLSLRAKL